MSLEQLAKEIREMLLAAVDDPENAAERDELLTIAQRFTDRAVVEWWTHCRECGGPLLPWATIWTLIGLSGGQAQFDALLETMTEFEHDTHQVDWLMAYPRKQDVDYAQPTTAPGETSEQRQARLFKAVIYDLSLLIDEFGYEAVYFGVGVQTFPDAVDPWEGNAY